LKVPIFRSRSYVFTLEVERALVELFEILGTRLGFRVLSMDSMKECIECCEKTDNLVCVLVGRSMAESEEAEFEKAIGRPVLTCFKGGDFKDLTNPQSMLQEILSRNVSRNFIQLAKLSLDVGFSSLSGSNPAHFIEDYAFEPNPQGLIYCDLVENSLFIRVQIEFPFEFESSQRLCAIESEEKLIDFFKELSNLTMGVVSHNLRKLNINARVSVPNFVDLRNSEPPKFSNFFSGAQFSCSELLDVKVRLGFFDTAGRDTPAWDSIEVDSPSSDVEFL
jgi:hypothetical protein